MELNMIRFIRENLPSEKAEAYGVYPRSLHDGTVFMADVGDRDVLVALASEGFAGEQTEIDGQTWVEAELTHENAVLLRQKYPFTAPVSAHGRPRSVGVGDRLGLATPGHIAVFRKYDAFPIFAQQSVRELTLTERTYADVLDSASWAVFREDFTGGFGADGDHLKTAAEVESAIEVGCTMITLDCSEYIRTEAAAMTDEEVKAVYVPSPGLEERYVGKTFMVEGHAIEFDIAAFRRMRLILDDAIDFAVSIYHRFFAEREGELDFEISIDETTTPTLVSQHYYIANELFSRGVRPSSMAPRFCGEFQKAIDYIGNVEEFARDFAVHAAIARHFGYKISVHSGSDKFSIFDTVGRETRGEFHLKTAGTNWLEAMWLVANLAPELYREIHRFARDEGFPLATKLYHVTTNLANIPDPDTLADSELPSLFANPDSRQLIHITFGHILTARNADGTFRFRSRLYQLWREHRQEYARRLEVHIGRHLELLYGGIRYGTP